MTIDYTVFIENLETERSQHLERAKKAADDSGEPAAADDLTQPDA